MSVIVLVMIGLIAVRLRSVIKRPFCKPLNAPATSWDGFARESPISHKASCQRTL